MFATGGGNRTFLQTKRVLGYAWSAPGSCLGLLLAPFFERRRRIAGVLLCEGARWPRRLGWRYRAITFGHVVLSVDRLDEATLAHELVHVRQWDRWGVLLLPAYLVASLIAVLSGKHHYRDNPFEIAARRAGEESGRNGRITPGST